MSQQFVQGLKMVGKGFKMIDDDGDVDDDENGCFALTMHCWTPQGRQRVFQTQRLTDWDGSNLL